MSKDVLLEMKEAEFQNRLDSLKAGFAEMEKINVRSIPENMFVTYFLPLFSGEKTDNVDELLSQWYTISGTSYSPVNIVDQYGRFIIQVPPLHDRKSIKPISSNKSNIDYTFKLAKEKSSLSPILAQNIISNGLKEMYDKIVDNGSDEIVNQWTALFTHYGKIDKKTIVSTNQPDDTDEFEF